MFLIRCHTRCCTKDIADYFGGRHPKGVMFSVRCVTEQIMKDATTRNLICRLSQAIDAAGLR